MSEGSEEKIVERNENRFLFRFQLCIALHLYTGGTDGRTDIHMHVIIEMAFTWQPQKT